MVDYSFYLINNNIEYPSDVSSANNLLNDTSFPTITFMYI